MPAWIHDRAQHLLAKNPSMPKSMAFGLATQQAHATGKTPKGYGTAEGKAEAKKKYDDPKSYKKSANPGGLKTPKLPSRTKRAQVNSIQFSAFGNELKSILKQAAIPLSVIGNPKFAPFFDRVAAGGASAPRLFKGGPVVHIPGVSPARQAGQAATQVIKTSGLKELLLKDIPGTKPWIVGPAQQAMRGLGKTQPVQGAGKALAGATKAVRRPAGGAWDVSRQAAEMGL